MREGIDDNRGETAQTTEEKEKMSTGVAPQQLLNNMLTPATIALPHAVGDTTRYANGISRARATDVTTRCCRRFNVASLFVHHSTSYNAATRQYASRMLLSYANVCSAVHESYKINAG